MPSLGRQWRRIEALADDPAFVARAAQEFPGLADALASPRRRQVLKLMAASLALGGLSGCGDGEPSGTLTPAVRIPANIIPAIPNFYATANIRDGYATGTIIRQNMGRPTKVEGNPKHPASLGATDIFAQAQVLDFYDPDRDAGLTEAGAPSDRQRLATAFLAERARLAASHGAGLRILTGTVTSPTLARQIDALLRQYPEAQWHQWDPISRDAVRQGAILAYGRPVDTLLHPDAADVILAIDSDMLSAAPGHLRYAREFASRRNPARTPQMSRVYAVEPTPSLVGVVADHRFVASMAEIATAANALAAHLLHDEPGGPDWVAVVAADLAAHRGHALIHAGPGQPAELHALVHAMNESLGGRGATYDLIEPAEPAPQDQAAGLRALVADMQAGHVSTLLVLDSNPVLAAPPTLGFADALRQVPLSLALSQTLDETSGATHWFVPMTHSWEAWSDARAFDGTATILQPLALPLYNGTSPHELLAMLTDAPPASTLDIVKATWASQLPGDAWHDALAAGIVPGTASAKAPVSLTQNPPKIATPAASLLTVLFRPDPNLWDGRYANNAWLQELPRPMTKLTWDNPLLIAPALATRLSLKNGDRARLAFGQANLTAPIWVLPGQAPDIVTALLGFGRTRIGDVGRGHGFNFYPLTGRDGAPTLQKASGTEPLASTEHHNLLLDTPDDIIRRATLAEFTQNPHFAGNPHAQPHIYRRPPDGPAAWAMSVDLNSCIGCNACAVACQAENNVPVVGKDQVMHEREMHWLRIDRYYEGTADAPDSYFQPMLCMHCEQAPCEIVCPVGATVHDSEGLNVMVYNRCVGTRFCSNNCPYKVRRFNYFAYSHAQHRPPQSWNPDVTVRARGVMEKCTFCLQRIAEARIVADRENRPVAEVQTACQAACPSQAITFGNLANPDSEVLKRKHSPLTYALLEEQNTVPRVTYEALVRNPNPALKGSA